MDHICIAVVNTKLFINKNGIKSRGTTTVTQTVTYESVNCHPTVLIQFFRYLDCIFIGLVTSFDYFRPLCPNRVREKHSGSHVKVHSGSPFR